jgi:hypothetical protein
MPSPLVIAQFARLVGTADLLAVLGLPPGSRLPVRLNAAERERLCRLAAERAEQIGRALAAEAAALDDIQDAQTARAYLAERLGALTPLVPGEAHDAIHAAFEQVVGAWAPSGEGRRA